jgi:hypothetical protein
MSLAPVAGLAIALALAPDAYDSQPPERGDLIIAVAGHPVRDALAFNNVMGHLNLGTRCRSWCSVAGHRPDSLCSGN